MEALRPVGLVQQIRYPQIIFIYLFWINWDKRVGAASNVLCVNGGNVCFRPAVQLHCRTRAVVRARILGEARSQNEKNPILRSWVEEDNSE